jgi:hypothetical protein
MEPAHQPDKPTEPPPSPERQQALLTLLADEDAAVSDAIRERLLAGGATTMAWLSRHRAHPDAEIRRRVRALLLQDGRSRADVEFLNFCTTVVFFTQLSLDGLHLLVEVIFFLSFFHLSFYACANFLFDTHNLDFRLNKTIEFL